MKLSFATLLIVGHASTTTDTIGPNLPFESVPTASKAGRTLKESSHQWRKEPKRLPKDAPNIVIFMSDDAGYGNPDTFGGPVHMPTMTRLAETGVTFNSFHTTSMCSPTRASLITGRNHHNAGSGVVTEIASDFDGYVGEIPRSTATVARVLSDYGYSTAHYGKWHNTPPTHLSPTGPFDLYPTGVGFDYFYGFLAAENSQYEPRLHENTVPIETPNRTDYHLTEDITDRAIDFIRDNQLFTPDRPFLLSFMPGAVHGPHQVHKKWFAKYAHKFDAGWEALRNETFAKQKAMGWIPAHAELAPWDETMERWEDIPEGHREFHTRLMEVYAGYLEHADVHYGKIVDELEAQGIRDNTLIMYVHSDNGASADGLNGTINEMASHNGVHATTQKQLDVLNRDFGGLDALGGADVENMYHHGWAAAGNAPFKSTKMVANHFGGTRTPLVVSWPKKLTASGASNPRSQFHHVVDIVPTIYDAVGISPPDAVDGIVQKPLDGVSMLPVLRDSKADPKAYGKVTQYFELMGGRGIYHNGWFAGACPPRAPWRPDPARLAAWDPKDDEWELYRLDADFSQTHDLAREMPGKVREMKQLFEAEAERNNVLPIGAGLYTFHYHPEEIRTSQRSHWRMRGNTQRSTDSHKRGGVPEQLAPKFTSGFSTEATIAAVVPDAAASGVLYCVGGIAGGFTVYMEDGYLHAEYNRLALNRYEVTSTQRIAPGAHEIVVRVKYDSKAKSGPATVTLNIDGTEVGRGRVEKSVRMFFGTSETFDIGLDRGSPVSLRYKERGAFPFMGQISTVDVKYI